MCCWCQVPVSTCTSDVKGDAVRLTDVAERLAGLDALYDPAINLTLEERVTLAKNLDEPLPQQFARELSQEAPPHHPLHHQDQQQHRSHSPISQQRLNNPTARGYTTPSRLSRPMQHPAPGASATHGAMAWPTRAEDVEVSCAATACNLTRCDKVAADIILWHWSVCVALVCATNYACTACFLSFLLSCYLSFFFLLPVFNPTSLTNSNRAFVQSGHRSPFCGMQSFDTIIPYIVVCCYT